MNSRDSFFFFSENLPANRRKMAKKNLRKRPENDGKNE